MAEAPEDRQLYKQSHRAFQSEGSVSAGHADPRSDNEQALDATIGRIDLPVIPLHIGFATLGPLFPTDKVAKVASAAAAAAPAAAAASLAFYTSTDPPAVRAPGEGRRKQRHDPVFGSSAELRRAAAAAHEPPGPAATVAPASGYLKLPFLSAADRARLAPSGTAATAPVATEPPVITAAAVLTAPTATEPPVLAATAAPAAPTAAEPPVLAAAAARATPTAAEPPVLAAAAAAEPEPPAPADAAALGPPQPDPPVDDAEAADSDSEEEEALPEDLILHNLRPNIEYLSAKRGAIANVPGAFIAISKAVWDRRCKRGNFPFPENLPGHPFYIFGAQFSAGQLKELSGDHIPWDSGKQVFDAAVEKQREGNN